MGRWDSSAPSRFFGILEYNQTKKACARVDFVTPADFWNP